MGINIVNNVCGNDNKMEARHEKVKKSPKLLNIHT